MNGCRGVSEQADPHGGSRRCGRAGEHLRIVDIEGAQVGDLFAFAAADPGEYLSASHTRTSTSALVFPSQWGERFLPLGEARWAFDKATAAVDGCDGIRLHDLRHTCASLAIRSGANITVVQRLLGHKTAVLTLDRYGHLFPDDLDAVADAFDSAADALRTMDCGPANIRSRKSL